MPNMESDTEEKIVMTPKKPKAVNSTRLKIERKSFPVTPSSGVGGIKNGTPTLASQNGSSNDTPKAKKVHVAGGSYAGIVINKQQDEDDASDASPSELCLEFRVYLKSAKTEKYIQERRVIGFWFKPQFPSSQKTTTAQEFFKTLVAPVDFPRDYVGFMKKVMRQMQSDYPMMSKVELELTQEKEMDALPIRPRDIRRESKISQEEDEDGRSSATSIVEDDILAAIEEAYPNSLTIDDMSRRYKADKEHVRQLVLDLVEKELVKPVGGAGVPAGLPGTVDTATGAFRRVHSQNGEENVTVVKQMSRAGIALDQPTIAVITAHYFEKMAVDAVMKDRKTFVRYATVGEANVYTLGQIGDHLVVSTKLPMTGRTRDALIATGGTTTRLLGTFQAVEKVFLVGVGGAVPHFADFNKHVRLGDVVLSAPTHDARFVYQYFEREPLPGAESGKYRFETKNWCPEDLCLQQIAESLTLNQFSDGPPPAWMSSYETALANLSECGGGGGESADNEWTKPKAETDKLFMSVGGNTIIEVGHPPPKKDDLDMRAKGRPVLHLGPVASGRHVALNDQLRQEMAAKNGILAFDNELDSVVDSIYGSRKESYMLVRGIADYKDGTKGSKPWQQYSALMAAAVLKSIVENI